MDREFRLLELVLNLMLVEALSLATMVAVRDVNRLAPRYGPFNFDEFDVDLGLREQQVETRHSAHSSSGYRGWRS